MLTLIFKPWVLWLHHFIERKCSASLILTNSVSVESFGSHLEFEIEQCLDFVGLNNI